MLYVVLFWGNVLAGIVSAGVACATDLYQNIYGCFALSSAPIGSLGNSALVPLDVLGTDTVHNLISRDAGEVAWFISQGSSSLDYPFNSREEFSLFSFFPILCRFPASSCCSVCRFCWRLMQNGRIYQQRRWAANSRPNTTRFSNHVNRFNVSISA